MFILLILFSAHLSESTLGVDVSQLTTVYSCIKSAGYSFASVRGYQSSGRVDPNVVSNIQNAKSGGMLHVDVYLFPCVPCGNPGQQAISLVSAIKGQNYGIIWLDVEIYAWNANLVANQNFIISIVNELKALGQTVGIYTSYYNWQNIVGISWTGCSGLPLWYAHYDNNPSFSDFVSFGGWKTPNIKQYAGDKVVCGAGVDLNFY